VRAIPRGNRNLELLESVELPAGGIVSITIDMPDTDVREISPAALPVRDMGAMTGSLDRDEIYGDRNS